MRCDQARLTADVPAARHQQLNGIGIEMEQGRIKHWNPDKGYGFISDEWGAEVFFAIPTLHRSSLTSVTIGDRVRFTRHQFRGREEAHIIELADLASPFTAGLLKTLGADR